MYRWGKLAKIKARCTQVNWRNIGHALFKAISISMKVRILINAQISLSFFCSQDLVYYNFYFTNLSLEVVTKTNRTTRDQARTILTLHENKKRVLYCSS